MPTYDYRCENCGHEFERFQSMTSRPTRVCPECGKRAVKRLIGAGGAVLFRGSGFYATDYRSKGYKEAAKKDKESQEKKETGDPQKGGEKKSSDDK